MKRALDWALLQATAGGGGLCGTLLSPPSLQALHRARAVALTLAQTAEAIRGVDGARTVRCAGGVKSRAREDVGKRGAPARLDPRSSASCPGGLVGCARAGCSCCRRGCGSCGARRRTSFQGSRGGWASSSRWHGAARGAALTHGDVRRPSPGLLGLSRARG